jgi:hypothetical protein
MSTHLEGGPNMLKNTCEHESRESTFTLGRHINGKNYLSTSNVWDTFFFWGGGGGGGGRNIMDLLVRIQVHARNQEGPTQGTFGSNKPVKHKERRY